MFFSNDASEFMSPQTGQINEMLEIWEKDVIAEASRRRRLSFVFKAGHSVGLNARVRKSIATTAVAVESRHLLSHLPAM